MRSGRVWNNRKYSDAQEKKETFEDSESEETMSKLLGGFFF